MSASSSSSLLSTDCSCGASWCSRRGEMQGEGVRRAPKRGHTSPCVVNCNELCLNSYELCLNSYEHLEMPRPFPVPRALLEMSAESELASSSPASYSSLSLHHNSHYSTSSVPRLPLYLLTPPTSLLCHPQRRISLARDDPSLTSWSCASASSQVVSPVATLPEATADQFTKMRYLSLCQGEMHGMD